MSAEELISALDAVENSTREQAGRLPASESPDTPTAVDCYSLTEVATTEQLLAGEDHSRTFRCRVTARVRGHGSDVGFMGQGSETDLRSSSRLKG